VGEMGVGRRKLHATQQGDFQAESSAIRSRFALCFFLSRNESAIFQTFSGVDSEARGVVSGRVTCQVGHWNIMER
jgi:hypothetical protein